MHTYYQRFRWENGSTVWNTGFSIILFICCSTDALLSVFRSFLLSNFDFKDQWRNKEKFVFKELSYPCVSETNPHATVKSVLVFNCAILQFIWIILFLRMDCCFSYEDFFRSESIPMKVVNGMGHFSIFSMHLYIIQEFNPCCIWYLKMSKTKSNCK